MRYYEVTSSIKAGPEAIWAILTDGAADLALDARPPAIVRPVRERPQAPGRGGGLTDSGTLAGMGASNLAGDPFAALGDPHRRAIVELLGSGGRSVREIADALPISRPAVSRHLRLLKGAGLVVEEPRGTRRIYTLHDKGVEAVQRYLAQVWGEAAARFRLVAEHTTPGREGP